MAQSQYGGRSDLSDKASDLKDKATDQFKKVADRVEGLASDAVDQVRDTAPEKSPATSRAPSTSR